MKVLRVEGWVDVWCEERTREVEEGGEWTRVVFFFFKQKTAYEIVDCDWSSDVCSSDLFIVRYIDRKNQLKLLSQLVF